VTATDEAEAVRAPEIRRDAPERAVRAFLPACAGVWTAAEIMHAAGISGVDIALASLAVAGFAGLRASHNTKDRKKARRHARHVAAGFAAAGGWLALATRLGPLAGPYCTLTLTWAGVSLCGWLWLRRHEVVVAARDWRNARTDWLSSSRRWGLGGSHLLHHEYTRLGERMIADVKGTGKRASAFVHSDVAERIAEERDLPPGRVLVKPHRLAGRLEISIRKLDPWANPVTHPVLCEAPEITLAVPCSAKRPVEVGQDPETGAVLPLPLWDERGGKNISIVGQKGAGKTVLLNCVSERVTAASDALMIRVNLSIKGLAEARRWGPACHLTAFGRHQQARALRVLRTVNKIIEWRSQQEYETDVFVPSPGDPLIAVVMDEIDSAAQVPAIRQQLEDIASKGREYGVTLIRAGQRGTAEWTGGGNVRANDDVFCIGMVNRRGEAMHAAGDLGLSMPDMATYGEGHGGVWVIAETGGDQHAGRTFMLKDPPDIARIVAGRAHHQPDLKPELKAFLGESYENLLSTDVYARWARDQQGPAPAVAHPRPDAFPDGLDPSNPLHALAVAVRDGTVKADDETAAALGKALDIHEAEQAAIDAYDREAEDFLDDDMRTRLRKMGERNAETRRILEEAAAAPLPDISHDDQVAHAAARWRQLGEATDIPDEAREILLSLLVAGTTISKVAEALGVTRWVARTYLERLRAEGLARIEGSGRSSRWMADDPPAGGDGT
jgi:hypothetical protein